MTIPTANFAFLAHSPTPLTNKMTLLNPTLLIARSELYTMEFLIAQALRTQISPLKELPRAHVPHDPLTCDFLHGERMWKKALLNSDKTILNHLILLNSDKKILNQLLVDALHSCGAEVLVASSKIVTAVQTIAEEVRDIKESIHHVVSRPSGRDKRIRRSTKQQTPVQSGRLSALIRLHVQTLFGSCMETGQLPPPATLAQKLNWKFKARGKKPARSDSSSDSSSEASSSLGTDVSDIGSDSDVDPSFPYGPEGPGHKHATHETLVIIWRGMRKCGVRSFRPDLTKPMSAGKNKDLWSLAIRLFIKLVWCREYDEINVATTSIPDIRN
ncbi:hypothetical protein PCASD_12195 [Puccinia coronata f. sp. avenae]|uniref:Uncharacterized protein n=1 Tax=Puccinia coronata f. sp. avenae TaxID=200324 RepID=A0A2N5UIU7_9BASI|nr:hypothetical protein PCASD_12195 [Puccinia coronata f. sp. avenae]